MLLKYNITVFCLDLSGSGHSDGEYVSLGYYERDDLAIAVEHLRQSGSVGCIGLWGRSMGAATALLHGDRDPSIAGMVLDSPFTSLRSVAEELVEVFIGVNLPKWLVSMALNLIRSSIKSRAKFDINDLSPISHVGKTFIPALFVAAESDTFIKPDHAKKLFTAYAGDKNLVIVDGDHNSARPRFFLDSVAIFFYNTLQCESLPRTSLTRRSSKDDSTGRRGSTDGITGDPPSIRIGEFSPTSLPPMDHVLPDIQSSPSVEQGGIHMRPPDRNRWDSEMEAKEDLSIQRAIEESLRHVAMEETPIDTARHSQTVETSGFI